MLGLLCLCVLARLGDGFHMGNTSLMGTIDWTSNTLAFQLAPPIIAYINASGFYIANYTKGFQSIAVYPPAGSSGRPILSAAIQCIPWVGCAAAMENGGTLAALTYNVVNGQTTSYVFDNSGKSSNPRITNITAILAFRDRFRIWTTKDAYDITSHIVSIQTPQPLADSVTTLPDYYYYLSNGGIQCVLIKDGTLNACGQPGPYNQLVPLPFDSTSAVPVEFYTTVAGVGFGLISSSGQTKSAGYFLFPTVSANTIASAGDPYNRVRYWMTDGNVLRHNQGGSPRKWIENFPYAYDITTAKWDNSLRALIVASRNFRGNWEVSRVDVADCGTYQGCQECLGYINGSIDTGDHFYCSYSPDLNRCVVKSPNTSLYQNSSQCPFIVGQNVLRQVVGVLSSVQFLVANGNSKLNYSCSFTRSDNLSQIEYTPATQSPTPSGISINCPSPPGDFTAIYDVQLITSPDRVTYATNLTNTINQFIRQTCTDFKDVSSCVNSVCGWCNSKSICSDSTVGCDSYLIVPITVSSIVPNYTFVYDPVDVTVTGTHFYTNALYHFLLRSDTSFPTTVDFDENSSQWSGSGIAVSESTIVGSLTGQSIDDIYLQVYRNHSIVGQPLTLTTKSEIQFRMCQAYVRCHDIDVTLCLFQLFGTKSTVSLSMNVSTNLVSSLKRSSYNLSAAAPALPPDEYAVYVDDGTTSLMKLPQVYTVVNCSVSVSCDGCQQNGEACHWCLTGRGMECLGHSNSECTAAVQCSNGLVGGRSNSKLVAVLAGAIGGGVALLLIIALIMVIAMKRRMKEHEEIGMERAMPSKPDLKIFAYVCLVPIVKLSSLEKMLLNDSFTFTSSLVRSVREEELEEFSRYYMYIALHESRQKGLNLLSFVLTNDVSSDQCATRKSVSASMFGAYSRSSDLDFVWNAVARVVWDAIHTFDDFSTENDTFVDDHVYTLLMLSSKAFNGLRKSAGSLTMATQLALFRIKNGGHHVSTDRQMSALERKHLGHCFFGSFVVSSIMHPHLWGICDAPVKPAAQRGLNIIGEVLLHLASSTMPSSRSPELKKFDQFVTDNIPRLSKYYDVISRQNGRGEMEGKYVAVSDDVHMASLVWMHNYIYTNRDRLNDPHMQKLRLNLCEDLISSEE
ncbi:hypothetical protein PROFUN_00324 [Planoprotostelium fungivorum]|uniref:Ras-GAP domain-containing protein n=1 Tax=Planoprotostelium fungivorum TaxID=1890364 RepID=A0A2P6NY24_9EUKA|nr:hypothetical protein PROFUN_00324 [Planoprotostelium fungivorum]